MNRYTFQSLIIMVVFALFFNCAFFSQTETTKQKFSGIVVFGDGLNDMGSWGKLTNFKYPPAEVGFYEGRWTNGKVWVEHFAESLNLPLSLKNNFAMGGATTGFYNINEPLKSVLKLDEKTPLLGMLAQVQTYLSSNPKIDDKTLFVLWAGGHDIGNYLEYGQPDLEQYPPANNYKQAIELLVKAGARNIFVGTMPDMGFTPAYFGTDKQSKASELSQNLNKGIDDLEISFRNTGVKFYKFDGANVFMKIAMNPANYGIKFTDAYLPFNIINFSQPLERTNVAVPNKEKGLNPDEFMNWWAVSASARVHKILAEEAVNFVKSKNK